MSLEQIKIENEEKQDCAIISNGPVSNVNHSLPKCVRGKSRLLNCVDWRTQIWTYLHNVKNSCYAFKKITFEKLPYTTYKYKSWIELFINNHILPTKNIHISHENYCMLVALQYKYDYQIIIEINNFLYKTFYLMLFFKYLKKYFLQ